MYGGTLRGLGHIGKQSLFSSVLVVLGALGVIITNLLLLL
jgi:hypothetical protein